MVSEMRFLSHNKLFFTRRDLFHYGLRIPLTILLMNHAKVVQSHVSHYV